MVSKWIPFRRTVNNGYTISTQDDDLLEQLDWDEINRMMPPIDWHLFRPGETILIDNIGRRFACTVKTDYFVELQEIIEERS